MIPTDSDVEVVARAVELRLFSIDAIARHQAASPYKVHIAQELAKERIVAILAADPGRKRMEEALRKIALAIPVEMAGASAMMCGTAKAALLWLGMDATSRTICDRTSSHD